MTIQHQQVPPHLNYFLCLEDDLLALSRWIEFCEANEAVYSIELVRLLMTAAAEAEVVAKALCKSLNAQSKASGINGYQAELVRAYPMLPTATVKMPRFGMTLVPWSNWSTAQTSPDWWQGYNGVKHHRADRFSEASLKNVLNASAGLLLLIAMYYAKDTRSLEPAPKLFVPHAFAVSHGGALHLYVPDGVKAPWASSKKGLERKSNQSHLA